MKFLLFFVSLIYSIIFYTFHSLSNSKDIFGKTISNSYEFTSFSGNLLIESFIFILIAIFFLYLFSNLKEKGTRQIQTYKTEILYFIFYIILIFYIYFFSKNINLNLFIIIVAFILGDIIFNHISNIPRLFKQKTNLRYSGLVINYFVSGLSMFYIYKEELSFIPFLIIIFNIIFNILVHKKYTNYISLFISILLILLLFYNLIFFFFDVYI